MPHREPPDPGHVAVAEAADGDQKESLLRVYMGTASPPGTRTELDPDLDIEVAIADLDPDSEDEEEPSPASLAARESSSTFLPSCVIPPVSLVPRSLLSALRLLALLSGPVLLFLALPNLHLDRHLMKALEFIQHHKGPGAIIFVATYGVSTALMLPISLLSVSGGVIFQPTWLSLIIVMCGVTAGSASCFFIGRYVFRSRVQAWLGSKSSRFAVVDRAIASGDARGIVVLLRMSPIIPFALLSYVLSLTELPLVDYLVMTFIGSLPFNSIAVVAGSFLGDLAGASKAYDFFEPRTKYVLVYISVLVVFVTSVLITLLARRALRRVILRQHPQHGISLTKLDGSDQRTSSMELPQPLSPPHPNAGQFTVGERRTLWATLVGALVGLLVGLPMLLSLTPDGERVARATMLGRLVGAT